MTPGNYYAQVYGYNGANNASTCYTLRVALGTATRPGDLITSGDRQLKVNMYPVPVQQVLNVNISGSDEVKTITVFDVNGRQVISRQASPVTTALDVANLSGGIYIDRCQRKRIVPAEICKRITTTNTYPLRVVLQRTALFFCIVYLQHALICPG